MAGIFSKMFSKKEIKTPNYVRPRDIKKTSTAQPIEDIKVLDNGKPNILFMDDNFGVVELMKEDIRIISELYHDNQSGENRYLNLYSQLNRREVEFLKDFNQNNYNFYFVTSNTCGMAVEKAIESGMKIDGAILDIILGGIFLEESGNARIIDGIDIAQQIKNSNKNAYFKMYTACTLGEYSQESIKFREIFNKPILDQTIYKNSNLNLRRVEIIKLLMIVDSK